mmetsp:Transcript_34682/g.80945  ORF Transcript_34682/g.80945 Transcript_34682/m.80945 type:complete len:218 (-) Transcript_34682:145-798(-)
MVLHLKLRQRHQAGHCTVHMERVPLSLGFVGLWLLHNCGDTVHSLLDEVLREASKSGKEPGTGSGPQSLAVLYLVLREMCQVPEQECVHSDRPDGYELLRVCQEGLLLDSEKCLPIRNRGNPRDYDPCHRFPVHHRIQRSSGLPHLDGPLPGYCPCCLPHHLRLHSLRCFKALHECIWPCSGHHVAVFYRLRGNGTGRRLRSKLHDQMAGQVQANRR